MNTYGYTVSNDNTGSIAEHYGILSYASNNSLGEVHFCREAEPDSVHGGKRILAGMVDTIERGDVLIVSELSRLGNTAIEVLALLNDLSLKGVRVYTVNGYRLDNNIGAQVVAMAHSLVTQIEKELPTAPVGPEKQDDSEEHPASQIRTRRSKLDGREDEIRSLMTDGTSLTLMASIMGTSRPCLTDFIKSRGISV